MRSTTKINEELLDNTNVKFVASLTSGEDHIDQDYFKNSNIHLSTGKGGNALAVIEYLLSCLLYTSPSPRDAHESRMPSSA